MRTRSRIIAYSKLDAQAYTGLALQCYSTTAPYSWVFNPTDSSQPYVSIDEEYSSIQDHVGLGRRPKNVFHWKYRKTLTAGAGLVRNQTFGYGYPGYSVGLGGNYNHLNYIWKNNGTSTLVMNTLTRVIPGVSVSWPVVDDMKVVQALFDKARKPVVDSLLNLYESPELPSALRSLTSYGPNMERKWQRIRNLIRSLRPRARARHLTVDAANKFLAYSFGISPLIADASKVIAFMKVIKGDWEKYRDRKVRRISYVYRGSTKFTFSNNGEYSFQGYALVQPEVRYVLTYREKNPYSTDFIAKLDYLIRRFGNAGPASFFWERIPFSFVVDWFIDTSSIIDYLDSKFSTEKIEVISLTRSQRFKVVSDCFRTVRRSDTNAIVYDERQGSVTHSYYERRVLAKTTYVDLSDRFGKKQAALSVALLRQQLKKLQ